MITDERLHEIEQDVGEIAWRQEVQEMARELLERREADPYPQLSAHRLKRAIHGLQHIASFWKDKPSGGYAASILEDIDPPVPSPPKETT